MPFIETSPEVLQNAAVINTLSAMERPLAMVDQARAPAEPEFHDSFLASMSRENSVISTLRSNGIDMSADRTYRPVDPTWNPYRYISSAWDDSRRQHAARWIDRGFFDDAMTANEIERRYRVLSEEERLIQTGERNFMGQLLGSAAGSLTDPLTYAGVGWAMRWRTIAGAAGRWGLQAGATQSAAELVLGTTPNLRTLREACMNVGAATTIGAGIGGFSAGLVRRHPLHPDHPNNPLREENLGNEGITARVPGEPGEDRVLPRDLSAAASDVSWAQAPEKLGGNWLTNQITWATPVGRMFQYISTDARNVLSRLMDTGGVFTRDAQHGVAMGRTAEDLKRLWEGDVNVLFQNGDALIRATRQDLAKVNAPTIDPVTFNGTARLLLSQAFNDGDRAALAARFGEQGAKIVEQRASEYVGSINKLNARFENELIRHGFIRDDGSVTRLRGEIEALRKERDAALETLKKERETAREADKATPRAANDAERIKRGQERDRREAEMNERETAVRKEFEEKITTKQGDLDQQMTLPEAMGDAYGHAQLWDRASIINDRAAFEEFLIRTLVGNPDEAWLMQAHKLTRAELDALKASDPERYGAILRQWAGDGTYVQLETLQRALDATRQREKQAKLDLKDMLRRLGLSVEDAAQANLTAINKHRDAVRARAEAARRDVDVIRASRDAALAAGRADAAEVDLAVASITNLDKVPAAKARIQERMRMVAREEAALTRAERKAEALYAKADQLDQAWIAADLAKQRTRAAREALQALVTDASKQAGLASKNVTELRRKLRGAEKETPLDQVVREITDTLLDSGRIPAGIMDRVVPETSARMKARRIILNAEQYREAAERGFLRTDLPNILHVQYSQLAGHLSIRDALDIGRGRRFNSWSEATDAIRRDYDRLIAEATDVKAKGNLKNQREWALRDADGLYRRLIGATDAGVDRDSWTYWLSKKAREWNLIRFGAGFGWASLTDVASVSIRHRILPNLAQEMPRVIETIKSAFGRGELTSQFQKDLAAVANAVEIGQHGVSLAVKSDLDAEFARMGVGAAGTMTHAITSRMDHATRTLSTWVMLASGQPVWNRFWKIFSGLVMARKLDDMVRRFDSLKGADKAELAVLGIGETQARRLAGFMERHATRDGNYDPNLDAWLKEPGGVEAVRDFRIAINRDMTRSNMTPGVGDTPLLMDKWYGRLWLQFQTFAFTFMNRFATPTAQRARMGGAEFLWENARVPATMATLFFWAGVVLVGKDLINGKDPMKRWQQDQWASTAYDLVERSGYLSYLSPYVDAGVRLAGMKGAARYQRNNWFDNVLGANFAQLNQAQSAISSLGRDGLSEGDWDAVARKGLALAPFSTHLRAFYYSTLGQLQ